MSRRLGYLEAEMLRIGLSPGRSANSAHLLKLGRRSILVSEEKSGLRRLIGHLPVGSRSALGRALRASLIFAAPYLAVAEEDFGIGEEVSKIFPERTRWTLVLGTEGPERKAHITVFNIRREPAFHIKVALGDAANELLDNEVEALRSSAAVIGPRLVDSGTMGGRVFAATEYMPPLEAAAFGEVEHLLHSLAESHETVFGFSGAWKESQISNIVLPLKFEASGRFVSEEAIAVHDAISTTNFRAARIHGDFAPWNVRRGCNGPALIDWEHSAPDGIVVWDALHWWVQTISLLHRLGPRQAVETILVHERGAELRRHASEMGVGLPQLNLLLRAYLVARIAGTSAVNRKFSYDPVGEGTNIGYWIEMLRVLR